MSFRPLKIWDISRSICAIEWPKVHYFLANELTAETLLHAVYLLSFHSHVFIPWIWRLCTDLSMALRHPYFIVGVSTHWQNQRKIVVTSPCQGPSWICVVNSWWNLCCEFMIAGFPGGKNLVGCQVCVHQMFLFLCAVPFGKKNHAETPNPRCF